MIQHLFKAGGASLLVLLANLVFLSACAEGQLYTDEEAEDKSSASYQQHLVAGIRPARQTKTEIQGVSLIDYSGREELEQVNHRFPSDTGMDTVEGAQRSQPITVPAGTDVVELNFANGRAYAVDVDEDDLRRLAEEAAPLGLSEPVSGHYERKPNVASGSSKLLGLSGAVENRTRFSIANGFSVANDQLAKIGHFWPGGTGNLFGRRLVITAAHALCYNGSCSNPTFVPRHDMTPSGPNGHDHPYGVGYYLTAWVGGYFLANNCHVTYNNSLCSKEDWAVVLLPDPPFTEGSGNPGFFGFDWTASEATLTSLTVHHAGYPECNSDHDPSNCEKGYAYGQIGGGTIGRFKNADGSGGFKTLFATSHDVSNGHSGGAILEQRTNGFYYIHGVMIYEDCGTCSGATAAVKAHPNWAKRMDEWLFNYMQSLRTMYP